MTARVSSSRQRMPGPLVPQDVATKSYVDSELTAVSENRALVFRPQGSSSGVRILPTGSPEDSRFVAFANLMNDIAYNNLRGGSITLTRSDGESGFVSDLVFAPDATFQSWTSVPASTVFTFEITLCRTFRYGQWHGVSFPTSSWVPENIKIERHVLQTDTWVTELEVTGNTDLVVFAAGSPGGANDVDKLRFTISGVRQATQTMRIGSFFALAYNSDLLSAGFVPRGGGDVYGHLAVNADPTAGNHLSRKAYVDSQLSGKVNNNDSRLSDARTPTAHNHPWSEITSKPTTYPPEIGSTATTAVAGNDARLTDARTPTAHTHAVAELSNASAVAKSALTAVDAAAFRAAIGAGVGNSNLTIGTTSTTAKAGDYQPTWAQVTGKPTTFAPIIGSGAADAVAGNDARLTNARTPTAHTHLWADITDKPTTFAPIIGSGATQAVAGNDARLSDARVPLDNSVTNVKIPAGAAIDPTKLGTGRVIAVDGAGAPLSITQMYLSQAQYDAIGTKDPNTEYNII